MQGVEEESAPFAHDVSAQRAPQLIGAPFEGLRRFRTFGDSGPMYEVLELRGERALVWLSNSDEEVELKGASLLEDPVAR